MLKKIEPVANQAVGTQHLLCASLMSSEDKTVEPSDQVPSPPSSSVGATSTGSPAHADKRPRGRPRKDAAAVLPQAPPSSVSKNRKKGRTRGRVVVDEEDSMDGTEITESIGPQDTETPIQPVETVEVLTPEVPEEDKPSSPLAQSPPAENSAGPSVPASREVKRSERLCAFCYCGGHSLLGQGEMHVFSTTPQLEALFSHTGGGGSTSDSSDGEKTTQPKMAEETTSGQREKTNGSESCEEEPDPASRFWDELSHVGLPQDLNVQSLFESGQCWAHQSCALWSEGVCEGEGQSLLNVDRAIDSGSTKHCAYCKRLGASIKCCAEGCAQFYHYPCAGAAGTFQDIRSLSLLCPEHTELAIHKFVDDVNCALCDSPGDLLDQLFCTSCGQHYHGVCLDMAVTPLRRAGWQCPECKVCQTCKNPGEDTKMLVCDMCDKGYHTFCLQPAMDSLPTNGWRCKNCRVCIQCGTRTSKQWHHTSLLCENCVQNQDPALCCLMCACILDPEHHKDLLFCHTCKRWLHLECERQNSGQAEIHPREDYVCSNCRSPAAEQALQAEDMDTGPELSPQPASMHTDSETGLQLAKKHTDLEPGTQLPPEMHNDPKPELLAVPLHSDPELVQATVQEEKLVMSAQKPEVSVGADVVERQVTEPFVNKVLTEFKPETKPAARAQLTSTESPSTAPSQESESFPVQLSMEALQAQDTTLQIKPAKTEACPEQGMANPSTKDFKAIISTTKEPSTASVPFSDQPMEVSLPQPSSMDVVRASFLETVPKELKKERSELIFHRNLAETVKPSASTTSEEMYTTPESKPDPSLSSLSSDENPLKTCVERLAEMVSSPSHSSPLVRGMSPRELAQILPPLGDHSSVMPTTTLIPLTPKIGMGKPAITKRKFSPGRPRVKQGAWSPHSSVSSPLSWSPDQPEGWDVPKTRQSSGSPGWSIRVGRGSGFPGRRRPRGAGLSGRAGRGRARGKNGVSPGINPGVTTIEAPYPVKEEEENAMHNTVVIFSSNDSFTLKQDMCVVCGSFGLGAEGRLLACAQCGQCYHPFCVGIKITKVVLSKGWRCLECTVCEACGQATDPGRLLLCDDCDISYHTYCLDPPLQNVPKDSWKCKWCVSCTQCGATTPGLRCEWQNNYTQCGPCASLATCPICLVDYSEGTTILQCRQCDRWFHASCQGLHSEEDVEKAADGCFDCTMCRAFKTTKVMTKARDAIEPVVMTQIVTKAKEMDLSKTYTQDGVCLTESGLCQLQSLSATASRRRKPKPKLKLKIINQNSVAVLQAPLDPHSELSRDEDMEDNREAELLDCEGKSDSSLEREPAEDDSKGADGGKKRKRKPYRPGIGGFMVRQRSRPGQGPGKAKRALCRKDSSGSVSENPFGKEEGWTEALPDTPVDETPPGPEVPEKIKKRYRKKKTKLEEAFPAYLQEAFFGKDLLDKSKQSRQQGVESGLLEEGQSQVERKHPTTSFLDPSSDPLLSASTTSLPVRPAAAQTSEEPLVDLSDVLNTDADILGMLGKPSSDSGLDFCSFQVDSSPPPFAGLDIGPLTDSSPVAPQSQAGRRTPRTLPEEPLDGILSPELDKMVTDESILSKLYKIPELEGKDVEDLFTAVLSPSTSQPPPPPQVPHPHGPGPLAATPGTSMPHPNAGNPMFPRMPMMNGMMGPNQRLPSNPGAGPCIPESFSPLNRMPFTDNPRDRKFNQMPREVVGSWPSPAHGPGPTPPGSLPEGETEAMSNAQRSTLKWEKEETLGELATVAPVLYTNVNFPNLKEEYPDWSTRVKQIAKLWRKASSQDRAPYVQKARDNRAALRINKVQMSNETVKRHHPQQQPPEVFDPNIPLDTELLFKDPLKPKESEHEQEWKFRQQMRQKSKQQAKIEATQKLEQVKNEQLQQQQQQQQQTNSLSEGDGNNSGNQSPASQPSNGSMSPIQQLNSKEGFARPQLPGTPTSGPPEDVFLRPPPPPPSGPSSQPQSPQVFSPGSSGSRPSSPWDPYAKMVGTPRPPTLGPNTCRRMPVESGKSPTSLMEQQDRGRPSPAHESFGSPTSMSSDPYAKPPDTPRPSGEMDPFLKPMGPPRASQPAQGRPPMGSPGRDPYSRPMIRNEAYQRMTQNRMILSDPYSRPLLAPIPGSNESGSVPLFKTPMPPPQTQDPFNRSGLHPTDRFSQNQQNDPYAQPPHTPRPSGNDNFTSSPRMGQHLPQVHSFAQPGPMTQMSRNPYAHAPSTPRPDHFTYDPFAQPSGSNKQAGDPFSQSTGNQRSINEPGAQPRPYFEPYARPPGTPRPHDNYGQPSNTPSPSSDPYSQAPSTHRPSGMNQFTHQSHPGQRMSPSHSVDPYAQPPGTPRPSVGDRFSKSPGSQRGPIEPFTSTPGTSRPGSIDMFSQPGAPRPMLNDPYGQPPGTPRPGPDGLSRQGPRLGPMGSQDPFSTPQSRLQEPFPHPGSQTPKHPSVSEDGFTQSPSRRPSQTPGHDPFEQAPMTPRPQSVEKMEMKDHSGVGNNGTDPGQLCNNPQIPGGSTEAQGVALAESEERLKQRQRIRELILKQQQQRSATRQERGPQEPAGNLAPGTPRPWPQEGPGQQGEMFNRPPPPYPGQGPMRGPMRFPGPFPGDQRVPFPNEGQIPRAPHPGDPNLRHQGPRFAFPPGVLGPHVAQEFFPRGQHPMQDVPPQMRRSMSAEMAKSIGGNPMGLPQHFPPRGMPVQQHNIMGQPFIELRHRAAENRQRMPYPPGAMQGNNIDPNLQGQRPPGFPGAPNSRFHLNQGPRMVDPMVSQTGHVQLSASMDNLHQQAQMSGNNGLKQSPLMRSMSQPASSETQNMVASMILNAPPAGHSDMAAVTSSEAVEEKLDAEESAVKDLEDVEVKDLVDADLENLNLDPEDGKDLDLETNDLHLDDFLTSGKFDIIAYTDPDLDDIKKDMFNEELDLSDPMDDNVDTTDINKNSSTGTEASSSSTSVLAKSEASGEKSLAEIKLEAPASQDSASLTPGQEIKTEFKDCQKPPEVIDQQATGNTLTSNQQEVISDSTPVLSSLLIKQQPEEQSLNPIVESVNQGGNLMPQQNQVTDTQHTSGLTMTQTIADATTAGEASMTGFGTDHQVGLATGVDQSGLSQAQQTMLNQALGQHGQQHRPLLLEEQPLLLQDLLDQERQEQQQQRQMQAMIRQRSSDSFFPNIDFDSITDPIMKAKMVALKGINKVMVQNNMGMTPMVMNRIPPGPAPPCPESAPLPPQVVGQDGKLTQVARPNPPNFGPGFVNNAQRAQYEEWLQETQQLLQMQQKFLEEKIGAHRKSKKALSAKQRTAKKAGREFPEEDAEQLKHVTEQQGVVQKQLEQIRKQQKEHAELIEEYRVKQQQNNMTPIMPGMHPMPGPAGMVPSGPPMVPSGPPMVPSGPPMVPSGPPMVQPPMNPMMQMPLHPGQPNVSPCMPNPPPGWHPGAPMPMGGPGMPPIMTPQIPVGNPGQPHQMPMGNIPQHSQMPVDPQAPPAPPGGVKPMQAGGVKFDDNNPFSEGFQERERRERLREQQERQRVQLMQEVERQRALKHRMEMEQQGMMGPDGNMAPLAQMPFFNSELPQDFMQPQRPPLQQQQQLGPVFPQQQGMQPGMGSPPGTFMQGERRAMMGNGMMPRDMGPGFGPDNLALQAPNFAQGQPRPRQFSGPGMMLQMPGEGPPFGGDSATPLPSNFPGSGQSLIQLYSNIIPDEKGKKKRNRKKKKDDDADSVKTPSTPHSDLTAPLTPCVSDTSSTPTRNTHLFADQDLSRSPLLGSSTPSHSELERQLSGGQSGQPGLSSDIARTQAQEHDRILNNIKLEQTDTSECHGPREGSVGSEISSVKEEGNKGSVSPFPAGQSPNKGEAGNELLKHLLKNKSTPPSGLSQQRSEENFRSEEEDPADCKSLLRQSSMDSNGAYSDGTPDFPGPLLPEQEKKKGRNKRAPKGGDKPVSRYKKRKKEGDERQLLHSGPDSVMNQIKQQLSLLPLMEPLIGVNFAHFAPYGSGQLNGENLLSGTFGSASLDGVSDYYSQLAYKQSNLSNPPTPPASLPPTPPPVNRQKMINGFATTEELASKAAAMVSKGLVPKPLHVPFRTEEDLLARAIAQGPKTVDVPASLPTPPHNNQEEISNRGQEPCKDRDTPDSFVPSSSPESVVGMEISRYPDLSLVKEEPPSPCLSPVLPMLPVPDGKGSEIKLQDIKTEPSAMFFGSPFGPMSNDSKQGLVSVAITLRPAAAENITGVVAAISDLLCVKIPSSYEVSSTPDRVPISMLSGPRVGPHGMEPRPPMLFHGQGDNGGLHGRPGQMIRPGGAQGMMQQQQAHHFRFHPNSPALARGSDQKTPASPGCKPQWCRHCKVVVLGNGVQKSINDLPAHMKESEGRLKSEEDLVFCSQSCFLLYHSSPPLHSRSTTETKESVSLLPASEQTESLSKIQHQYSNNMSSLDVHCLAQLQPKQSPPSTPPIPFPTAGETSKTETKSDAIKVTVKLKARPRSHEGWHQGKRPKGLRWRKWTVQVVVPRGNSQLPDEDKIDELLKKLGASLRPPASLRDHRRCCFCHQFGDGITDGPARLLNLDLDVWVHLNCALWSTEVYETQAGALINVELALRRGQTVRCAYCQQTGATSGCHRLRCTNVYHFTCALQAQCTFFKDKTMLCHAHRPRGTGGQALEHELRCFAVFRRVYVQRDEVRQIATAVRQPELGYTFRVGSLVLHAMGQLTPQQMAAFHSPTAIFPVGYEACRIYWSMRHGNRRCRYVCSVEERDGLPEFSIRVIEQGYQDLVLSDTSAKGVWDKVLGPVAEKRTESGTLKLFPVYLKGEDLFGLTVPAVTKITESLPGVEVCDRYSFRYGRNPLVELPLMFNPAGSARAQPRTSSPYTSLVIRPQPQAVSSSSARSNQNVAQGEGGAPHSKPPVVHPRSSQYRWMKSEWRANVYLARSRIQGLGLFAAKDIEKQTMMIEYNGTILRNEVAIRKEKIYRSQNREVFMFRIDSEHVVDATRTGGLARYINHSCAPNCVAEVVTFERGYKIIISCIRRIDKGEELCFDYQFDTVEGHHKIACHCGAPECRKWIN
ncbi:histone-lysine N-methyltransferase 2C isoform X7 [Micropterus dolomieu]|uniref:histone-lysine N-methyltransferase 2C isoform X7 n=1 Tax=Micropterus dolomieu TaxID=147949 RepID=UPI001E8D97F5|nr:histone-lysine N-methyltransferase 2C isoform X7 [Micropterus dolomieu]